MCDVLHLKIICKKLAVQRVAMRNFDKMIDQRKKNSEGIENRIRSARDDICRGLENLNICEEKEGSSANTLKCEVNDLKKDCQKHQTKTHENKENYCSNDSKDGKFICSILHQCENIVAKEELTETNRVEYSQDSPSVALKGSNNSEDNGNDTINDTQTEKDVIQNRVNIETLPCSEEYPTERNREKNLNCDFLESESSEENETSEEVKEKENDNSTTKQTLLLLEKLKIKETKDDEEEESSNETQDNPEVSESRENDLCSRGPIHHQNFRKHVSHAPYLFSQSRQCGGIVEVQDTWIPVNSFEPNIKLNIDAEESFQDHNHNPIPQHLPSVTSSFDNNGEPPSQDLIKNILEQFPDFGDLVDSIATECQGQNTACNINNTPDYNSKKSSYSKSCGGSIEKGSSGFSDDESWSTSPVGSPQVGFTTYNHPSSSRASISSSSGVSTIKGSPQHINESFNETSNESLTAAWVKKHSTPKLRPICPKPPPSNVDPNSYKAKLMTKLDCKLKIEAWVQVNLNDIDVLCAGDDDGDTNLMIIVANKSDSQMEYIYAMVEKLRDIPGALSQKNNAGHSALYLACLEMCDEPIIAAYIAEALVEQNVDIAKDTYGGLTLPQILQRKGDPCKGVLRELLRLKNRSGQFVFHSFLNECVNVQ